MASDVQICNLGLAHLGNRGRVASIDPVDGSAEADYCASFFSLARNELLAMADWTFARKRVALALVTGPTTSRWEFAYSLPSDCLVPRRILTDITAADEQDSELYAIEGAVLMTNKEDAVLVYTRPIITAGSFSPSFVTAFGYLMAAYLAGPILKGIDGTKASIEYRKIATAMAMQSVADDANRENVSIGHTPSNMAARHGLPGSSQSAGVNAVYGSGYVVL
jgi:hypothetical protein